MYGKIGKLTTSNVAVHPAEERRAAPLPRVRCNGLLGGCQLLVDIKMCVYILAVMPPLRTPCHCSGLRRATRVVTSLYDRTLEPSGLTLPQLSLLRQLKRAGPLSVTRLAVVVGLERTTLGRNLLPLEQKGLVESVASNIDARERVVQVTSRGDRAMKSAAPLWRNAQQLVEQGLGRERLEVLHELLDRLAALEA